MALRFYNTLTQRLEEFRPLDGETVRMYTCGPTVYHYVHIGNFRTFSFQDVLRRVLRMRGWKLHHVMNITDVDDKIIRNAVAEGKSLKEYTERFTQAFLEDAAKLRLERPEKLVFATEHIPDMVAAIQRLAEKRHTYESEGSTYFRIASFPEYGKLSHTNFSGNVAGARVDVDEYEKADARDFVLWKARKPGEPYWDTPLGAGRPGWHIECSVMAMQYLGETIDLHAGGEDLIFPHHECEIAQSESLTGKPFANTWIHTRFLQVDGEKMSKSKGNFYTVRDLVDGDRVDPLALRYALITVPYGKPLNFTRQTLRDAAQNVDRFRECARLADAAKARGAKGASAGFAESLRQLADEMLEAMCDDLNTSVALAKALGGTSVIFKAGDSMTAEDAPAALAFLDEVQALLGIVRPEHGAVQAPSAPQVDEERIEALIAERAAAKKARDFARADAIRAQLDAEGIELRDTPEGTHWRFKTTP
ncbi:MAG TPA: cysteine--tRNA ligase [Armatimonadetes bacterium]|nr:cysteine--tRNA ligase [Armatimonadota bacterium]